MKALKSLCLFLFLVTPIMSVQVKAEHIGLVDEKNVLQNFFYNLNQYIDTFEKESVVTRYKDCFLLEYRPLGRAVQAKLCLTEIEEGKYFHQFIFNNLVVLKTVIIGEFDESELEDLHFYRISNFDRLKEFRFINFYFEYKNNHSGSAHLLFDSFKIFIEKTDESITYYPKCSWCNGWAKARISDLGIVYMLESSGSEVGPISFYKELDSHINMFSNVLSSSLLGYFQRSGLPKNP